MLQIDSLTETLSVLDRGGIILFPTDTVWSIGCDACNPKAVEKLYALKRQVQKKPFILLADSIEMVGEYVEHIHPRIDTLLSLHRRPLTVVYEQARNLPPNLVPQDGSIAFRVPQDIYCKDLIQQYKKPIVVSSANICNQPFPRSFGSVSSEVIQGVDYVVPNLRRKNLTTEPSVIVRLSPKGELNFLRE